MKYNIFKNTYGNEFISTEECIWGTTYVPWEEVEEIISSAENPVIPPETVVYYIDLPSQGGSPFNVSIGDAFCSMTLKYNYSASCWCFDLTDAIGNIILAGVMAVPYIDLLLPHPYAKSIIGSLVLIELNEGDYTSPSLIGMNTKLLWTAPGEATLV